MNMLKLVVVEATVEVHTLETLIYLEEHKRWYRNKILQKIMIWPLGLQELHRMEAEEFNLTLQKDTYNKESKNIGTV